MEFKELTTEELTQGYTWQEESGICTCIFCGEQFEQGLIYRLRGRMVTAERAMTEHILHSHGGVFHGLIDLDKQINGLSESQKDILEGMYLEKDNRELSEELGISAATVRTHKFNIQRMKREAKILLAILEQVENESLIRQRKHLQQMAEPEPSGPLTNREADRFAPQPDSFTEREPAPANHLFPHNSLHPFFTQYVR